MIIIIITFETEPEVSGIKCTSCTSGKLSHYLETSRLMLVLSGKCWDSYFPLNSGNARWLLLHTFYNFFCRHGIISRGVRSRDPGMRQILRKWSPHHQWSPPLATHHTNLQTILQTVKQSELWHKLANGNTALWLWANQRWGTVLVLTRSVFSLEYVAKIENECSHKEICSLDQD